MATEDAPPELEPTREEKLAELAGKVEKRVADVAAATHADLYATVAFLAVLLFIAFIVWRVT